MCKKLLWLVCVVMVLTLGSGARAVVFSDDFQTMREYLSEGPGTYTGMLDEGLSQLNSSLSKPGLLYMESAASSWGPGPGPLLYVEVTGDFVATVKVADFAGTIDAPLLSNDAGIIARNPASDGGVENWVSVNYFPTWTGFIARSTADGVRDELGQTAGRWTGVDTYAIAEQYPYLQLERVGSDFYTRVSADGVNFIPLNAEAYTGVNDGNQAPLVISRPDLPETLQIGLFHATYSGETGYVAFDDFTIVMPEPPVEPKANIVWVSFHGEDEAASAGAAGAGFTEAPDKGYTDLLKAAGYGVTRYVTTATPDAAVLNAADLVIIGRSINSGHYQNAAATLWNGISAPMIIMSGYTLRNSRMGFTTGATMPDIIGDIALAVNDPTHPIFAGIALTDGVMDNPFAGIAVYPTDGTTIARGISINSDPVNPDGVVLATVSAASGDVPAGAMVIGEWQAGALLTHAGGAGTDMLSGHRLVFLSGSREAAGINSETAGMFDLFEDGAQMFLNAINYMLLPPAPVHSYTFEDGTANDSVGGADGVLVGGAAVVDGALVTGAQDQWMEMPGDVIALSTYSAVTLEAWYTPAAGANTGFTMLAYFGDSVNGLGSNGYFITAARADDKSRTAISIGDAATPWASESGADGPEYDDGLLHHMVSTIDGVNITLYIDGVLMASTPLSAANVISGISPNYAYLAKGGYTNDPEWIGAIHEFNIYADALTANHVKAKYAAGPALPAPVHSYTFEDGTANDSVGGADGVLVGGAAVVDGALVTGAQDQWMEMPGDVIALSTYSAVTLEAWYTPAAGANTGFTMLAYFGDSVNGLGSNGYFITAARADDKSRTAISIGDAATPWASESGADGPEYDDGLLHHMVSTIDGVNITLYIDGVLMASTPLSAANVIGGISPNYAYLAKGGYTSDPEWIGAIHEFNIYNKALSEAEVASLFGQGL
jgi:hypothetical protein